MGMDIDQWGGREQWERCKDDEQAVGYQPAAQVPVGALHCKYIQDEKFHTPVPLPAHRVAELSFVLWPPSSPP